MTDKKTKIPASTLPGDELDEVPEETAVEQSRKGYHQIQGNDVLLNLWREGKIKHPPLSTDLVLQEFTVERDNNRPLQFRGYLIGWNRVDYATVPRGTQVSIFVTRSGKIITAVHQWQRSEKLERQRHDAGVHQTPEDALEWLIQDGNGKLGRASREAWEIACSVWSPLQGHEVEVID